MHICTLYWNHFDMHVHVCAWTWTCTCTCMDMDIYMYMHLTWTCTFTCMDMYIYMYMHVYAGRAGCAGLLGGLFCPCAYNNLHPGKREVFSAVWVQLKAFRVSANTMLFSAQLGMSLATVCVCVLCFAFVLGFTRVQSAGFRFKVHFSSQSLCIAWLVQSAGLPLWSKA